MTRSSGSHSLPAAALAAVGGFILAVAVLVAQAREIPWESYAGNAASQRYSPAADITTANVASLVPAWTWTVPDAPSTAPRAVPGRFEGTPLMIDGVLYVTTPFGRLAALDAETGVERGCTIRRVSPSGRRRLASGSCIAARPPGATAQSSDCSSGAAIG